MFYCSPRLVFQLVSVLSSILCVHGRVFPSQLQGSWAPISIHLCRFLLDHNCLLQYLPDCVHYIDHQHQSNYLKLLCCKWRLYCVIGVIFIFKQAVWGLSLSHSSCTKAFFSCENKKTSLQFIELFQTGNKNMKVMWYLSAINFCAQCLPGVEWYCHWTPVIKVN